MREMAASLDVRMLVVLACGLGLGAMSFGFRLGYFRGLGWGYLDSQWRRSRFFRNGMFALPPASLALIAAGMVGLMQDLELAGGSMEMLLAGTAVGMMAISTISYLWPASFMKPDWIRRLEAELRDHPRADSKRMDVLDEIRASSWPSKYFG
jgi:hypothetical protein